MHTAYPALRSVLRPELAESSDAFIESLVMQHYGGALNAADADEFLGDIGRSLGQFGQGVANVARQAAPHVMNALPGVLSGAATGAALGPWGALAGAAIGGVTSAVGAAQARPQAQAQAPRPTAMHGGYAGAGAGGRAGGHSAGPQAGQYGAQMGGQRPAQMSAPWAAGLQAAGQGVGGQIAGLLARPEVQQALMSQLMGSLGRQNVSVGGAQVPTSAVMNMMGALFQRAGQPAPGMGGMGEDESIPAYLLGAHGEMLVDAADPEARADRLVEWFESSTPPDSAWIARTPAWRDVPEFDEFDEHAEFDEDESIAFDDSVAVTTSMRDFDHALR